MILEITPGTVGGNITVPPSKSLSHRAIIAASLADGESVISNVLLSEDIKASLEAVENFGADINIKNESNDLVTLTIKGNSNPQAWNKTVNCNESGSTLRFLIPILAIDACNTKVTGKEGLAKRPLDVYFDIFNKQNYKFHKDNLNLPLVLNGSLKAGDFELPGNVSSQFISGLLFALPLLKQDSTINLTSPLESAPYVDLTIEVLSKFGIKIIKQNPDKFIIPGNQIYQSCNYKIPGDFSQASFWFVNGAINSKTTLVDLGQTSLQGDFEIVNILKESGVKTEYTKNWLVYPGKFESFSVDITNTPDLAPILAVLAALADGKSIITGIKRLKIKESNRVESIRRMLENFGVDIKVEEDQLEIVGQQILDSTTIDPFNDHRIAIAAAIAAGRSKGKVTILDAECVNKSYPTFWQDFISLGGKVDGIDMG